MHLIKKIHYKSLLKYVEIIYIEKSFIDIKQQVTQI